MTTELSNIIFDEENIESDESHLYIENLSKTIMDFMLPLETRIQAINLYYENEGGDNTVEFISKLSTLYEISGTSIMKKYLFAICTESNIEPLLKSFAARALWSYNNEENLAYQAINIVYPLFGPEIGTPYKIDFVKILMNNDEYEEQAVTHFSSIINDDNLDCDFRYKTILDLEHKTEKEDEEDKILKEKMLIFISKFLLIFLKNENNKTMYRLLAAQYILQNCEINKEQRDYIENCLLLIAKNTSIEYDLRADATDVLLQLASDSVKEEAQEIIMELGRNNNIVRSIYDNAQNAHNLEIEASVLEGLQFLHSFNIMKVKGTEINYDYVKKKILKILAKERKVKNISANEPYERENKIVTALNRISLDRMLYSKYNCTLSHVLLRVWTYLSGHKHQKEIKKRLLEELYDMSGTCSTGFIGRLVNTISEFGDFSLRISWRDQIISNFTGRLNARIRDMDNLTFQEKVLAQMILETEEHGKRKHFLKFLRRNIPSLREELYNEFKELIDDTDFDMYFRDAVSMYETGKFV